MNNIKDARLFEDKYEQYKNTLFRIAFTYLKNEQDCEDVIQEVFIKYLYNSPQFENEEHEKRWLIRVTINKCKNHLDLFWNRNRVCSDYLEQLEMSTEEIDILSELMNLPEKYKVVIYLHYVEGYKVSEISEILNVKISAVKMRLKKGRELLRIECKKE